MTKQEALDSLKQALAELKGIDTDELSELEDEISRAVGEIETAYSELEDAKERLENLSVPALDLDSIKSLLEDAVDTLDTLDTAKKPTSRKVLVSIRRESHNVFVDPVTTLILNDGESIVLEYQ
jgi:prefoldin subunit 5